MAGSNGPSFQFEWQKGADVPCDITWCRTVVAGSTAYVTDYAGDIKVFSYGPKDDSWEFVSSETVFPRTAFFGLGSFRDNPVFAGGKDLSTSESSNVITVCVSSDKPFTNPFPPMLAPRVDPTLVVGWGNYLIVGGGIPETSTRQQSVEVFDADKDVFAWRQGIDLPVTTTLSSTVINDTVYILGDKNKLYEASLRSLATTQQHHATYPYRLVTETPFKNSTVFSYGGHLLTAGGVDNDSSTPVSDIMYLSQGNRWIKVGDLPHPCISPCCIEVPKDEAVFLMAGKSNESDSLLMKGVYRAFRPIKI